MRYLWVVEIWNEEKKRWEATVGARLCRVSGRLELDQWRKDNPGSKFQLVKYEVKL
jgi:hypothetical protein